MRLILGGKQIESTPIEQQRAVEAMNRGQETVELRGALCYLPQAELLRDSVQMRAEAILKREG